MEQKPSAASAQSANPAEIDFFQLCITLWEQRLLIFVITGLITLCGVVFTYLSPDRFKAEDKLYWSYDVGLPELPEDLTSFKGSSIGIEDYAFGLVQRHLSSEKTAFAALEDPKIEAIVNSSYPLSSSIAKRKILLNSVKVMPPNNKKNRPYVLVSLLWDDAVDCAQLIDGWIQAAMQLAKSELVEIHNSLIVRELSKLDQLIEVEKSLAQTKIDYEISRLKEAKTIARDLELKSGDISVGDVLLANLPGAENIRELRALYQVGSDKLDIEIRALESRKEKADFYIDNISELLGRRNRLLAIAEIKNDLIVVAKKSDGFFNRVKKVGPSVVMIISLSVVIGLLLGMMTALVKTSLIKRNLDNSW